jgi:exopolysaccharide biosynthesis protein
VKIGADFNDKTLTSAFARENQCSVAINGEAGATPSPNSGLGTWRGHMVQDGKVLLVEDSRIQRPFLAFDASNGVKFISAGAGERAVPADARNVIWGRWDVILDGAVSPTAMRDRQPRTAMAINREGTRLYLLVVDGRQPRYSTGMTRTEVGQTLQAFSADCGMLCDEGGSSCIYIKQLGGIANVPSDNQGQERPTYTHFGITLN